MTVKSKPNTQNKPNFKKDLKRGSKGESLFLDYHPEYQLTECKTKQKSYDFINPKTEETVELKTDFYCMDKTPNYFIERFSDYHKRTLGGPFRCHLTCDYYVYLFHKQRISFWFNTKQLVERVNEWAGVGPEVRPPWNKVNLSKGLVFINNGRWQTAGHKVPRSLLEDLVIESWEYPEPE